MQTEESALYPRLRLEAGEPRPCEENGVRLDARRLGELRAGLPAFRAAEPRARAAAPPAAAPAGAVAVALVGAEVAL